MYLNVVQAINSLNKYPLPLQSAKEAKILQNFGDGICKILDDKLQRYYRENGMENMCADWLKRHSRLIADMLVFRVEAQRCSCYCRRRLDVFALCPYAGQNASIHSLPKGAPSLEPSDNNTLAPRKKVKC